MAKIIKIADSLPKRSRALRGGNGALIDLTGDGESLEKTEPTSLKKSILNILDGANTSVERLAFEEDPTERNVYERLYQPKIRLLPDVLLKRIAIQDDLVASIVHARSNYTSAFGRVQVDRFSTGFKVEPRPGVLEQVEGEEQRKALLDKLDKIAQLLMNCGYTRGWDDEEQMTLSQFLSMTTRDAIVVGRFATEIIWIVDPQTNEKKFHSFRPIDAGTIYKAAPQKEAGDAVRREALHLLEDIKNKDLEPEKYVKDEYSWVQVINGRPIQAFTSKEAMIENCYPVTDIMLNGYPLTPLDTIIAAVTTHINITNHNKLYFQTGRAAKGMLVIRSNDVDINVVKTIRQQFNASINNVVNSWRMPVFGIGADDELTWQPIDAAGGRDMEFQYLSDQNARVILSAFQMSPEELPGYAHLCLHPHTQIWTNSGIISIGDLLGDKDEVSGFAIWTGIKWEQAKAFVTGPRHVRKTTFSNGISLVTSPDHLFRIVDEHGELAWRKQEDLSLDNHVLVNRNPIQGEENKIPSYNGRKLTTNMMEILGWMTGDGTITVRKRGKTHHSKELEFYYHHDKEVSIRERHVDFLKDFGLNPHITDRKISERSIAKNKIRCGFKSISSIRRLINLYDTKFVEWLLELGFNPSTERKTIPSFIHILPIEYRCAFLRGFFSADGSKDKLDTPSITIADDKTRYETKLLLSGLGIRTRSCEGTHRLTYEVIEGQEQYKKENVKLPSRLIIKDKKLFFEKIGFLQPHKQPTGVLDNSIERWDKVPRSVAVWLANQILTLTNLNSEEKDDIRHIFKDPKHNNQARSKVVEYASRYGITLPVWLNDYYYEQVVSLETEDKEIEMVDVEVFDTQHAFMAEGIVVHNSRGTNSQALAESNNQYKLEAARDVGIRPLLAKFQDFFNSRILPLIDPEIAKICWVRLVGLDADTPEKESIRLQQDSGLHMTQNDILSRVEKDPLPVEMGGEIPLSQIFRSVLDAYFTVGQILEHFCGIKDAAKDPSLAYRRDMFWFQWYQMQMQIQQAQQQQQMGAAGGGGPQQGQSQAPQQGPQDASGGQAEQGPDPKQTEPQDDSGKSSGDLNSGIDQLSSKMGLSKSEAQLPPNKRKLVAQHREAVKSWMSDWEKESQEFVQALTKDVVALANKG